MFPILHLVLGFSQAFDRLPDVPGPFLASGYLSTLVSYHEGHVEATHFQRVRELESVVFLEEARHEEEDQRQRGWKAPTPLKEDDGIYKAVLGSRIGSGAGKTYNIGFLHVNNLILLGVNVAFSLGVNKFPSGDFSSRQFMANPMTTNWLSCPEENLRPGCALTKSVDVFSLIGLCVLVHSDAAVLAKDLQAIRDTWDRRKNAEFSFFCPVLHDV